METTATTPSEVENVIRSIEGMSARDRYAVFKRFGLVDLEDEDDETDTSGNRALWAAEIRRRVEEIKSGKVVGIPAEEVDRWLDEKYP